PTRRSTFHLRRDERGRPRRRQIATTEGRRRNAGSAMVGPLPTTRSGGSALGPAKSTGLLAWARWARFIARATRSSVAIDVPPELSSAFGYGPILGWPHSLTNCLLHRLRVPCRGARSLRP